MGLNLTSLASFEAKVAETTVCVCVDGICILVYFTLASWKSVCFTWQVTFIRYRVRIDDFFTLDSIGVQYDTSSSLS